MKRSTALVRIFLLVGRLGFGCLFLVAAGNKIVDSDRFAQQIVKYEIVGPGPAAILGITLPWLEFVIGCCLLTNVVCPAALLGSAVLLATFTGARIWVLSRGLSVECGCGVFDSTITPLSVVATVTACAIAIAAYIVAITMRRDSASLAKTKAKLPSSLIPLRSQQAGVSACA